MSTRCLIIPPAALHQPEGGVLKLEVAVERVIYRYITSLCIAASSVGIQSGRVDVGTDKETTHIGIGRIVWLVILIPCSWPFRVLRTFKTFYGGTFIEPCISFLKKCPDGRDHLILFCKCRIAIGPATLHDPVGCPHQLEGGGYIGSPCLTGCRYGVLKTAGYDIPGVHLFKDIVFPAEKTGGT